MAIKYQSSFASGEIDPALQERTTLEKYRSSLNTARNVVVGKTGRLVSRPGRKNLVKCKLSGRRVILHVMSHNGSFLEWGHEYVRIYTIKDRILIGEHFHSLTEDDLDEIHFSDVDFFTVAVFKRGQPTLILTTFSGGGFSTDFFDPLVAPQIQSITPTGSPAGYAVSYAVTAVINGEETLAHTFTAGNLPVAASQYNTIVARYLASDIPFGFSIGQALQEMRVYRRPAGSGAYGYIGNTTTFGTVGIFNRDGTFTDFGQAADFSNSYPLLSSGLRNIAVTNPEDFDAATGVFYQQRLLLARQDKIEASRPAFPGNFYRDFPLSSGSALSLKVGSEGFAEILRMYDSDGLVVFTTQGIFVNTGLLSPTNLSLAKKGNWVIEASVPPIAVPGGILFIDSLTNTVRQLSYTDQYNAFSGEELSIFSDHLFIGKQVKSWAFQDGEFPLLWIVFSDGTTSSFTFEREHQMRAWTRGDSATDLEYVASSKNGIDQILDERVKGQTVFVSKKGDDRYIEMVLPRYVSKDLLVEDPEADKSEAIAAMDGVASWKHLINDDLTTQDLVLAPVTPDEWDGPLTLTSGTDNILTDPGVGAVGAVIRWFNPTDKTMIDLTVTARAGDASITVSPSEEFPSAYATNPRLYETRTEFNSYIDVDLNDDLLSLTGGLDVVPVSAGVWDGPLTLTSDDALFLNTAGELGQIGTIFLLQTGYQEFVTLTVIARASDTSVTVMPSSEYPSSEDEDPILYYTYDYPLIGFDINHLNGDNVAIIADGYVIASPNNDIVNYPTVTVTDGAFTMPAGTRAAILHVGRPYTMDIETLDIDTVEQKPTLIESKTANKLYVKTYQTRGLYIGARFPEGDTLTGNDATSVNMVALEGMDAYDVNYEEENPIVGNRYDQPTSKRHEITLPGDWKTQGRVCIRQVDPLHFEILSIIPDLDVLWRED